MVQCKMQFVFVSYVLLYIFFTFVGIVSSRYEWNTLPDVSTRATAAPPPKVISKTCLLLPQEGPCRGNISMYYYDYDSKLGTGSCNKFRWGGCQGNGNRFDTLAECLDTCESNRYGKDSTSRPRWCMLTFDYGFCFGDLERWYFDRLWGVCKKTIYSGCGGNKNNFYNKEQCDKFCRFGQGKNYKSQKSNKLKNRLIINPSNATPKRGRDQAELLQKKI